MTAPICSSTDRVLVSTRAVATWRTGTVLGQSQSLQTLKTLGARPLQIGEVVLGTLARDGDFGFEPLPRLKVHNPVLCRSDTGVE